MPVPAPANAMALFHRQPSWLRVLSLLVLLAILLAGVSAGILMWPREDEANYLLQARWIAEGQIPYRDFFEFIPPAGQYLTALFYKLAGFTVIGTRLLVLGGWIAEITLLYKLARQWMPPSWSWLLATFLWVTDTRYIVHQHHFWSGFFVVFAVYSACRFLQSEKPRTLVLSGLFSGLALWTTQSTGALALMAFTAFVLFANRQHLSQWLRYWFLTVLGVSAFWSVVLLLQGAWPDFIRDNFLWLWQGHYTHTTLIGYFSTFGDEMHTTLLPLLDPIPLATKLVFSFRLPIALQLILLGVLPIAGVLLNGLFYWQTRRATNQTEAQRLLITLSALALLVATCSYSTSMHLTSNGGLGILLGFLALHRSIRQSMENLFLWFGWIFCGLLQIQAIIGAIFILMLGSWLPTLETLPHDHLVLSEGPPIASAYLNVIWYLNDADQKHERVFLFNQSQTLYLATRAKNATRYRLVIPIYTSDEQLDEILSDLNKNRPLYIVNDQSVFSMRRDPRFASYTLAQLTMPRLMSFIACHYEPAARLGQYIVYQRRPVFAVSSCQ